MSVAGSNSCLKMIIICLLLVRDLLLFHSTIISPSSLVSFVLAKEIFINEPLTGSVSFERGGRFHFVNLSSLSLS